MKEIELNIVLRILLMSLLVEQDQQQEREYGWQLQGRTKPAKYNVRHSVFTMIIRSWHSALGCARLALLKMLPALCLWELSSSLATDLTARLAVGMQWKGALRKFLTGPAPLCAPTRWRGDKRTCCQGHHGATCSVNVLYHWKSAALSMGLSNFVSTVGVKSGRIWTLGIRGNKRVNLKTEQTGDWSAPASLLGWNCALADGSLKTICAARARDVWQDFQHLRKHSKEYCLSGAV